MKYIYVYLLFLFSLSCVHSFTPEGINDIMGTWNPTTPDFMYEDKKEVPEHAIIFNDNGKKYVCFLNSLVVEKNMNNVYRIICEGNDTIVNCYVVDKQIILEVLSERRKTQGKIGINFITKDIIYFTLLEGETYSFIRYGENYPYKRAWLFTEGR